MTMCSATLAASAPVTRRASDPGRTEAWLENRTTSMPADALVFRPVISALSIFHKPLHPWSPIMLFTDGRLRYSFADISNFLRARTLAAKADAAIDQAKFQE